MFHLDLEYVNFDFSQEVFLNPERSFSMQQRLSGHHEMVHVHDNFGRTDDHLPPGKGGIDWRELLGSLETAGFNGMLMLELAGHTGKSIQTLLDEAEKGRAFLKAGGVFSGEKR